MKRSILVCLSALLRRAQRPSRRCSRARATPRALAKFTNCSVRTKRWHLVSIKGGAQPAWELYDVAADPGEKSDIAGQHADVVARLAGEFDAWWTAARVGMVNEKAVGPRLNPFAELYWKQFGGGPDAEDLRIMEPSQTKIPAERATQVPVAR